MLVEWLEELIFLADTEGFVADTVDEIDVTDTSLRATLSGRNTSVEPLVKAATYHGLHFSRADESWHARVVLDV